MATESYEIVFLDENGKEQTKFFKNDHPDITDGIDAFVKEYAQKNNFKFLKMRKHAESNGNDGDSHYDSTKETNYDDDASVEVAELYSPNTPIITDITSVIDQLYIKTSEIASYINQNFNTANANSVESIETILSNFLDKPGQLTEEEADMIVGKFLNFIMLMESFLILYKRYKNQLDTIVGGTAVLEDLVIIPTDSTAFKDAMEKISFYSREFTNLQASIEEQLIEEAGSIVGLDSSRFNQYFDENITASIDAELDDIESLKKIFGAFINIFSEQFIKEEEETVPQNASPPEQDDPLDNEDPIDEDEGGGSAADGTQQSDEEEGEENEAIDDIPEEGEGAIEDEEQLDFDTPEEYQPLSIDDYNDLLEAQISNQAANGLRQAAAAFDFDNQSGVVARNIFVPASNMPGFSSHLTPSFVTIDLPEPVPNHEDSMFVYNYYDPSEEDSAIRPNARDAQDYNDAQDLEVTLQDGSSQAVRQYAQPARYNLIKFRSTIQDYGPSIIDNFGELTNYLRSILFQQIEESGILDDISEGSKIATTKILTEGGLSSFKYSASELVNTDIDSSALDHFFSILNLDSNTALPDSDITTKKKSYDDTSLEDVIKGYKDRSNLSSEQFGIVKRYLNSFGRKEDLPGNSEFRHNTQSDFIRHVSFSMTFDNASFYDVFLGSDLEFGGLLENELDSYKRMSKKLYQNVRDKYVEENGSSDPINSDLYDTQIPQESLLAFRAYSDNELPEESSGLRPSLHHIGYVVERIKVDKLGRSEQVSPIFLSGEATSFIDLDILYGFEYVYKIRTLCLLEYDFLIPNLDEATASQYARGAFLITSRANPIRIKCIETVPPKPPDVIRFRYNYENNFLELDWIYPHNPQEDIVGFEIFRRESIDQPFRLIAMYNFAHGQRDLTHNGANTVPPRKMYKFDNPNTTYTDIDFNKRKSFIYTVASIDAHGMVSGYGPQYEITFDMYTNTLKVNLISEANAPKSYPNYFVKDKFHRTFMDAAKTSNKNRLTVCFNPKYYDAYEKVSSDIGEKTKVNLISKSKDLDQNYILEVLNVDLAKSQNINISIDDRSIPAETVDQLNLQDENLSFIFNDENFTNT